jgi:hypothetical protein
MSSILMPDEPDGADALNRMLRLILEMNQKISQLVDTVAPQASAPLKFLTPKQFAGMPGVDVLPPQVQEWARQGRIDAIRIDAKAGDKNRWRISISEYDRFVAEGLRPRYGDEELAEIIDEDPALVLQWCEDGRLKATKVAYQSGFRWRISADELRRYRGYGLLPKETNRKR